MTIVEEIAKSGASTDCDLSQSTLRIRRNILEMVAVHVVKQQWTLPPRGAEVVLVHLGVNMAVHDEDIFQPIVIVVQKTHAPAKEWDRHFSDSCLVAYVGEVAIAFSFIQGIVVIGEISDEQVELTVVVVVTHCEPHRCLLA